MPDEPTMWELKRTIESGYREHSADIAALNQRLDQYVLKEVYEAHRAGDQQRREGDLERIARIEGQVKDLREANRKAIWTAISSFLAPIAVAIVLAIMLSGG